MLRGMLRASSGLNIVFDGNSLVEGSYTSPTLPELVLASAPIASSGATVTNLGIPSQTWRMMNGLDGGSSADVDGAWVNGKYNVLVLWETINSLVSGRTVTQCAQDCIDYIAARKAVHPWRVILLTALPRAAVATVTFSQWNDLAIANYRSWGADLLVHVRDLWPFNFDGNVGGVSINTAAFQATQQYWYETSDWTHINAAGFRFVADWVCSALRRLPKRAPT